MKRAFFFLPILALFFGEGACILPQLNCHPGNTAFWTPACISAQLTGIAPNLFLTATNHCGESITVSPPNQAPDLLIASDATFTIGLTNQNAAPPQEDTGVNWYIAVTIAESEVFMSVNYSPDPCSEDD